MSEIKNIAIQDCKLKKLAAKAETGHMDGYPGNYMIIAADPTIQPGMALTVKSLYWVGAPGLPAMVMKLDTVRQGVYVFWQVKARSWVQPLHKGDPSTLLEEVIAELPWLETFTAGAGVDAITGGTSAPGLKPLDLVRATIKSSSEHYRFIQSEDELNQEVEAAASGKYNIEGVTVSGSTSYLSKIKFSELTITLIAEYQSEYSEYDEAASYELTDDAKKFLSEPAKFRSIYGDYFVSGGRRSSRFLGIYTCTSTSVDSMEEFKASFGAEAPDVFSAEGSTRFMQAVKQSNMSVSVDLFMRGHKGIEPSGPWTPEKILDAMTWFKANEVGTNLKAKLRHYCTIAPTYPRIIPLAPDAFVDLRVLFTLMWDIRARYGSLPDYYQKRFEVEYTEFNSGVTANQAVLALDATTRQEYKKKAEVLHSKLEDVYSRMDFYFKVVAIAGTEPKKDDQIEEVIKEQQRWQYGFSVYSKSSAVVIHTDSLRYAETWTYGRVENTLEDGPDGSKLFVGWEVVSNWHDGTNGSWWKAVDKILLTDHGAVHVQSEYDRGCDWTVNFYWVDPKDYQFGK